MPSLNITGEKDSIQIQVCLLYHQAYSNQMSFYVNNINTSEGGTHVSGFKRGLTKALKNYGDKYGLVKKAKIDLIGDDFREGLIAIISLRIPDPQFEGQTKTKLGNPEVAGIVDSIISNKLYAYLEEHPKRAKIIWDKFLTAARARIAAKKAREMVQKKNVILVSTLPGKLADCSIKDPSKRELYIVEGDSAGGSAKQGRNRGFQAILPLRGKILNVEKAQQHKIYDNEEIKNMIISLGFSSIANKDEIDIDKIRYHKIIIMTDADIDGSHIRTLILTFFFRYLRTLIEEKKYLYIAQPPLYLVRVGKQERYCWSEEEKEQAVEEFSSKKQQPYIQRYKGLGEMNPDQLWETTMNPENRLLKRVEIESAIEADKVFSVLMGEDVKPRREFIEKNATYANIDI